MSYHTTSHLAPRNINEYTPPLDTNEETQPLSSYDPLTVVSEIFAHGESIIDPNGDDVTQDAHEMIIASFLGSSLIPDNVTTARPTTKDDVQQAYSIINDLYGHDHTTNMYLDQVLINNLIEEYDMPDASLEEAVYTVDDIKEAAHDLVSFYENHKAGKSVTYNDGKQSADMFAISIANMHYVKSRIVLVPTEHEFYNFCKKLMDVAYDLLDRNLITKDTYDLCKKVSKLHMNGQTLTQSMRIRNDSDNTPDYSFARVISRVLTDYINEDNTYAKTHDTPANIYEIPMSFSQIIKSQNIVFVNAKAHDKARRSDIQKEWVTIKEGAKVTRPIPLNEIMGLPAAAQKAKAAQARLQDRLIKKNISERNKHNGSFVISKDAPPPEKTLYDLKKVLLKEGIIHHSHNSRPTTKLTYSRPNRREPNNPYRMGKMTIQKPIPDIHVYADTSASMDETKYGDTVVMLMELATKLKINFYFSSFADDVSESVLINTKGKSKAQLMHVLKSIPKVTGGTHIIPVFNAINASKKTRERINIVPTDFGIWDVSHTQDIQHPSNVFYTPSFNRSDPYEWQYLKNNLTNYIKAIYPHYPKITSRMLGF